MYKIYNINGVVEAFIAGRAHVFVYKKRFQNNIIGIRRRGSKRIRVGL